MDINHPSINNENENEHLYTILKGRFKAIETNTYGLFIIFFNDEKKEIENLIAIASHYSSLYDIDPHLPWYSFEENIINTKWKGDIALNITIDLQNYLESSLDKDRGYELLMLIKNNDQMKIESLLQAILMKPLSDRNIIIEVVSETVTKETMRTVRSERNKVKETGKSDAGVTNQIKYGTILDVDLLLAPVSGIPIYELKKGDRIMVKIVSNSPQAKYYINKLGLIVENSIIPIPGDVIEITKDEKGYTIIVKLKKGLYGKAIETEQVKIKRYDTLINQDKIDEEDLQIVGEDKGNFPIFIMILGGLMFVILLIFIIMWFYNIL